MSGRVNERVCDDYDGDGEMQGSGGSVCVGKESGSVCVGKESGGVCVGIWNVYEEIGNESADDGDSHDEMASGGCDVLRMR